MTDMIQPDKKYDRSARRILSALEGRCATSGAPLGPTDELAALTDDSRRVVPGSMFVAVRGTAVDGHRYIPAAIAAGARVIVCEELPADAPDTVTWVRVADSALALGLLASEWWDNPSRRLALVGVTGTNGKTTIATLLYEMARDLGLEAGLLSTVENRIGDMRLPADHTTPGALEIQRLLALMVEHRVDLAAMEVSSHAAAQKRIAGLDFDGGIFTNLTRDHLDYHGSFAAYLAAKKSFFDSLPAGAFALSNLDDRNGEVMMQNTRASRHTYSLRLEADFRGRVVEDRIDGMTLSLNGREVETMFAGRFNASNLTAVYGASILMGWDPERVLVSMSRLVPVNGRFQPMRSADGVVAIVDYAHTPDALVNVLDTIAEVKSPSAQVITVCGAGGDRDRGKRPIMAREAAARSSRLVLTSDNPRSENPDDILADMVAGLDDDAVARTLTIADRRTAIRTASMLARPGDIILVAGKGHEDYQVIGTEKIHFDDHEEIAAAFALRAKANK